MVWTVTADAEEFWRAADSHLRAHRVGSTVVLTIVDALRRRGPAPGDPPRLAWWDAGDGASAVVEHLAAAWDASTEVVVAERLHRLDRLRPPAAPSPTRPARDADRAVLWSWLREFHREATPDDPLPPRAALDAAIEEGRV